MDDHIVHVTGGLGRIGRAVCHSLLRLGAEVVALDNDASDSALVSKNDAMHFCEFDATDTEYLTEWLKVIETRFGPAFGWVNCAYPRADENFNPPEKA